MKIKKKSQSSSPMVTAAQLELSEAKRLRSMPMVLTLFMSIAELFKVDEHLQFIDRPYLFTLTCWRQTSLAEFAHIGSRSDVWLGLEWLEERGMIELADIDLAQDECLLRYRDDEYLRVVETMKQEGVFPENI